MTRVRFWVLMFLVTAVLVMRTAFAPYAQAALSFNDGNYVRVEDSASLDITDQITLEAWIYKTWNGEDWNIILSKPWDGDWNPWHVYRMGLTYAGNVPKYALCTFALTGGIAGVQGTSVIPDNTWTHIACTYDGSMMTIYVNGTLEGSVAASGNINTNNQPFIIGKNLLNSWNDWFGYIDDVRVWNIARTHQEIQENMNRRLIGNEQGLVGYWKFDEMSGTTANDSSGNGNTGTLIGNPAWVNGVPLCTPPPADMVSWWKAENNGDDSVGTNHGTLQNGANFAAGKVGQAFSFDGVDDYVLVGDPIPASLKIQNEITLMAWVYIDEYPGREEELENLYMIAGSQYDGTGSGVSIFVDGRTDPDGQTGIPPGHIHFQIGNGSWHVTNSKTQIPLSEWVHIAATRKAGENGKIYYNGVLQPSESVPWSGNITYNGSWFAIGQQKDWNRPFKGLIDEVAIFNRALTAEEIAAIYNAGSAGMCPIQQYNLTVTRDGSGSGTVTSSPAGINCGGTCDGDFNEGTVVTLTATPDAGSTFAGWGGDCTPCGTDSACIVTMDADKGCNAIFDLTQYNLTLSRTGIGSGTVTSSPAGIDCGGTCDADFNEGTAVSLTATPDIGSSFVSWGDDCSSCGTGSTCNITMDEDKACSATFDLSPVSGPDLVVSSLTAPESARPGSLIRVRNSVTNQGTEKAGRSKVGFYLSANNNPSIDPEDLFMGSRNVPTLVGPRKLAPGKTSSTKKGIRIPSDTVAGTYYIKAKADYQDVAQETDETNNILVSGEISIQ